MNIQQQQGVVSTLQFIPYLETEEYQGLRTSLFDQAMMVSNVAPSNRIDVFDETIMIFENHQQALNFLIQVFRAAVTIGRESGIQVSLRSSLCHGNYFVHQDQIYGDAVNLATKLSCSSRENELRVCDIDRQIIDDFINSQGDVACFIRTQDENCVSIALLDEDSTNARTDNKTLQVEFDGQSKTFAASRNTKINIGRADSADIYIVGDHISRSHATITLNYGDVFIEDHSANGTFVYFDGREVFLNNESLKVKEKGKISCGRNRNLNPKSTNIIGFEICDFSLPITSGTRTN
jgi:hypothetical protein